MRNGLFSTSITTWMKIASTTTINGTILKQTSECSSAKYSTSYSAIRRPISPTILILSVRRNSISKNTRGWSKEVGRKLWAWDNCSLVSLATDYTNLLRAPCRGWHANANCYSRGSMELSSASKQTPNKSIRIQVFPTNTRQSCFSLFNEVMLFTSKLKDPR